MREGRRGLAGGYAASKEEDVTAGEAAGIEGGLHRVTGVDHERHRKLGLGHRGLVGEDIAIERAVGAAAAARSVRRMSGLSVPDGLYTEGHVEALVRSGRGSLDVAGDTRYLPKTSFKDEKSGFYRE